MVCTTLKLCHLLISDKGSSSHLQENNMSGNYENFSVNFMSETIKTMNCTYCGKKFADSYCLKMHVRIHTGERPFACLMCSAAFTQQGNLMRHMRIHTGEKPFRCSVCDYGSNNKSNLKKHMLIKHGF